MTLRLILESLFAAVFSIFRPGQAAPAIFPAVSLNMPVQKGPVEVGQNHPLGIRNNNPGNIRTRGTPNGIGGRDPWLNLIGEDANGYGIFRGPEWGIRAMFIELRTGFRRDREDTIREIITEWAPSSENNTGAYIASVVQQTGIPADMRLSEDDFPAIARAIIRHENGQQPYSDTLIDMAYGLAQ